MTVTEGVVSPRSAGLLGRVFERVTDLVRVAAALDEGAPRDGDRAARDDDGSRLRDDVAALEALLAGVPVAVPLDDGVPVPLDDGMPVPVALDEGVLVPVVLGDGVFERVALGVLVGVAVGNGEYTKPPAALVKAEVMLLESERGRRRRTS